MRGEKVEEEWIGEKAARLEEIRGTDMKVERRRAILAGTNWDGM
jgi:hypothetical protein